MVLLAAQETRDQRQGLGPVEGVGIIILHKAGKLKGLFPLRIDWKKKKSPGPTQGDMQILVSFSLDFGIEGIKTFPLEFVTTNFPSHGFESSNL